MTLKLVRQKRTLGFKLESTPYTAETLAATDYDFSAYDIEYSPAIESYARKLARGDFSLDTSVSGRRSIEASWSVDFHGGAAAGTAPQYFQMLRACAMEQSASATGVWLKTAADQDRVPATIEIVERQEGLTPKTLVIKAHGCMGNPRLSFDQVGNPIKIEFSFKGVLTSVTTRLAAAMITPTAFDSKLPPAVLAATITLFGNTQGVGRFVLDLGNEVEIFTDASKAQGYEGARVVGRNPSIELDPDMLVSTDEDLFTQQTSNNTGQLSITVGENLYISAPAAQYVQTYTPGEREGHVTNEIRCELKRSSGDDEVEILQGSK